MISSGRISLKLPFSEMIFAEPFDRGLDYFGDTDSVLFQQRKKPVPAGPGEASHYPHRVRSRIVLQQDTFDEGPEVPEQKEPYIRIGGMADDKGSDTPEIG